MTPTTRLKAVRGVLARSARLGPREGTVCLLAWALLHGTVLRLRFARLLPGRGPTADPWSADRPSTQAPVAPGVARLSRLFAVASEHRALGVWCLPRALALRRLLGLHGFAAQLALGLRRDDEGLKGHAWVVYDGAVLGPDGAFVESFVRCDVA